MAIDYTKLTEKQLDMINDYLKNDMRKLKGICYSIWGKRGLPSCYHDDLYDDAMNVLVESVMSYDSNSSKFNTFLVSNINRSYKDWYRDTHLRAKRNNLLLDENGKIAKDDDGKPIIIQNISLDAPIGDDDEKSTVGDMVAETRIASDYDIDKTFFEDDGEKFSEKMLKYINRLSTLQQEIVKLIISGYMSEEIKQILHINEKQYQDCMLGIKSYRNVSILF